MLTIQELEDGLHHVPIEGAAYDGRIQLRLGKGAPLMLIDVYAYERRQALEKFLEEYQRLNWVRGPGPGGAYPEEVG